jgi:AAA+ ATPase superfamily predicted ATPase
MRYSLLSGKLLAGIVDREFSVTDTVKSKANVQRGLYKLTDNFFGFWYTFVFPNISELEAGDVKGVYQYNIKPKLDEYASRIFESICIEYLRKLNMHNQLPFRYSQIGRWWEKGKELDIMAIDNERKNFILGECKFKNSIFSVSDYNNLKSKFSPRNENTKLYYYLFSRSGFTEELQRISKEESIKLITLDDM